VLKARRLAEICVPAVLAAPRGATATAARFRFLTEPGEVNGALKTLFEQGAMAPHTSDAARAAQQDIDTAKGVINQHLAEARAELLDALGVLGADDEGGYAALGPIIEVAGDAPEILDHLAGLLMSPPRGQELFPHVIPGDELVRHLALAQLAGYAGKGSEAAKARILEAVGSPDPGIQAMAVLHVYAFSPNRHLAQRAMRSRLGPQSRHLLYEQ
jgi:hypothetical protein